MILKKRTPNFTLPAILFAMLIAFTAFTGKQVQAQEPEAENETDTVEVSFPFEDEKLLNFFDANKAMSEARKEFQEQMAETVAEEGLTLERFQQIANANKIGALQDGAFSEEEIQAFNNLGPKISAIQKAMRDRNSQIIVEKGFESPAKYQEILNEYRKDEALRSYVNDLLRERRKQEILEERRKEAEEKAKQEQEEQEEEDAK